MKLPAGLTLALAALVALPACSVNLPSLHQTSTDGDTVGALGQVDFTYDGPFGGDVCDLDCGFGMPLMVGDSEGITVGPHVRSASATLPPLAFSSSDPTVFDVSPTIADGPLPTSRRTVLHGIAAGSATLILRNATTGAMVDSAPVRVAAAASITVAFQPEVPAARLTTGDLTLSVGEGAVLVPQVEDAAGELLAGWSGVTFSIADETVATMASGDLMILSAVAKGQTTLRAQAGAAATTVTITVE